MKSSVDSDASGGVPRSLGSGCVASQLAKTGPSPSNARHLPSARS